MYNITMHDDLSHHLLKSRPNSHGLVDTAISAFSSRAVTPRSLLCVVTKDSQLSCISAKDGVVTF